MYIPSHLIHSFILIIYTGSQLLLFCQKPGVAAAFVSISACSETATNYRLMAGECRAHAYCIYFQNTIIH
jgi:hypothetical protein